MHRGVPLPKIYIKQFYSVEAAIHLRVCAAPVEGKIRELAQRARPAFNQQVGGAGGGGAAASRRGTAHRNTDRCDQRPAAPPHSLTAPGASPPRSPNPCGEISPRAQGCASVARARSGPPPTPSRAPFCSTGASERRTRCWSGPQGSKPSTSATSSRLPLRRRRQRVVPRGDRVREDRHASARRTGVAVADPPQAPAARRPPRARILGGVATSKARSCCRAVVVGLSRPGARGPRRALRRRARVPRPARASHSARWGRRRRSPRDARRSERFPAAVSAAPRQRLAAECTRRPAASPTRRCSRGSGRTAPRAAGRAAPAHDALELVPQHLPQRASVHPAPATCLSSSSPPSPINSPSLASSSSASTCRGVLRTPPPPTTARRRTAPATPATPPRRGALRLRGGDGAASSGCLAAAAGLVVVEEASSADDDAASTARPPAVDCCDAAGAAPPRGSRRRSARRRARPRGAAARAGGDRAADRAQQAGQVAVAHMYRYWSPHTGRRRPRRDRDPSTRRAPGARRPGR